MKKILIFLSLCILFSSSVFAAGKLTPEQKEQKENRRIVRYYAKALKVDVDFCDSIAFVESKYKTGAYNNPKGPESDDEDYISRGVMQLTFFTAHAFNKKNINSIEDMYVAEQNIIAGVRFIKYLFKYYPDATYVEIAQLYNLGETKYNKGIRNSDYVDKFLRAYNKIHKN